MPISMFQEPPSAMKLHPLFLSVLQRNPILFKTIKETDIVADEGGNVNINLDELTEHISQLLKLIEEVISLFYIHSEYKCEFYN